MKEKGKTKRNYLEVEYLNDFVDECTDFLNEIK